jgi:Na+/melibiose symporter-like transporter
VTWQHNRQALQNRYKRVRVFGPVIFYGHGKSWLLFITTRISVSLETKSVLGTIMLLLMKASARISAFETTTTKITQNYNTNSVCSSQRTQVASVTKTNKLMLFYKCGQNTEFLNKKHGVVCTRWFKYDRDKL